MKPRVKHVYVDTSVIGGCYDPEFSKWSNKLFDTFRTGENKIVLSDVVLEEIEYAPPFVREVLNTIPEENKIFISLSEEAENLAKDYLKAKAVSPKYFNDALHIAIASLNNIDVLVSWNFKHIVNLARITVFNSVNLLNGLKTIEIRTPREIIGE